jgi:hypothetical protein
MPTKAELLEQADAEGIDVPSGATKADVEALLGGQGETDGVEPSGGAPDPQAASPEQFSSMPVAPYLSDLTPAQRRFKMSHWP